MSFSLGGTTGSDLDSTAVENVGEASGTMVTSINTMGTEASAAEILDASLTIQDAANSAAANVAATEQENNVEQQAVSTIK